MRIATKLFALLIGLFGIFGYGEAIICYQKSASTTSMTNGSSGECTIRTCFSSMTYADAKFSSGCGNCSFSSDASCFTCNTDYCNSRAPSSISCFAGSSSSMFYNGSMVSCPTGVSSCFSTSSTGHYVSGCGSCQKSSWNLFKNLNCIQCYTDNCNNPGATPLISCYQGDVTALSSSPTSALCPASFKSCFVATMFKQAIMLSGFGQYISATTYYALGCGDCTGASYPYCVSCNSSNCNTMTPSSISCYTRYVARDSKEDNGEKVTCPTGVSKCYSTVSESYSSGGCGRCSSSTDPSCTTCSSDFCNSVTPVSISCYSRYGFTHGYYGSGERRICPAGITTCYSRVTSDGRYYGDCGRCSNEYPNCSTCSTNYCNTIHPSSSQFEGLNEGHASKAGVKLLIILLFHQLCTMIYC